MWFKLWTTDIDSVKLGTTNISAIYSGSVKVRPIRYAISKIMPNTMTSASSETANIAINNVPWVPITTVVANSWYHDAVTYRPRQMYKSIIETEKCNVVQVSGTSDATYTDSTYTWWTQAQFSEAIQVTKVYYTQRAADASIAPVKIDFQVSNNGSSWTTVHTETWGSYSKGAERIFTISSPAFGTYFRLLFTQKTSVWWSYPNVHWVTITDLDFDAVVNRTPPVPMSTTILTSFDSASEVTTEWWTMTNTANWWITVTWWELRVNTTSNDSQGNISRSVVWINQYKVQARIYTQWSSWGWLQMFWVYWWAFAELNVTNHEKAPSHRLNMTTAWWYTWISWIWKPAWLGNEYSTWWWFSGRYVYEIEYNNGTYIVTRYNDTTEVTGSSTYTHRQTFTAWAWANIRLQIRLWFTSENYNRVDWIKFIY